MSRRLNSAEKLNKQIFNRDSIISEEMLEAKIISFSKPTLSYFLLLTASIIIATLGLLINSSAIVIGSMLISPLTWPLFGLADGASLGKHKRIKSNLILLTVSIVYGFVLAYLLTLYSPIQVINSEILARSQPTLIDAVIALTAGGIGILAIVRKNIADSIAGVAIALSLTPPLCVMGISLALREYDIVTGSFLLLLTNALSITLVAGLILVLVHYSWRRQLKMAPKAFLIMAVSLLITAVPLYELLGNYSLETTSYAKVQEQFNNFNDKTSLGGSIRNISTRLEDVEGVSTAIIEADIFLPNGSSLTFEDKDSLRLALEEELQRPVDLRLRLQSTTEFANSKDLQKANTINEIKTIISSQIKELDQAITITDISVTSQDNGWLVSAQLSGFLESAPAIEQIDQIKQYTEASIGDDIVLQVAYSRVFNAQTTKERISLQLLTLLQEYFQEGTELVGVVTNDDQSVVWLEVRQIDGTEVSEAELGVIKTAIRQSLDKDTLELRIRTLVYQEIIVP